MNKRCLMCVEIKLCLLFTMHTVWKVRRQDFKSLLRNALKLVHWLWNGYHEVSFRMLIFPELSFGCSGYCANRNARYYSQSWATLIQFISYHLHDGIITTNTFEQRCLVHVLSTDHEVIPARNVIDAHAQDFVVNDKLLLSVLKTFAQYTCSLHATGNACCILCVYVVVVLVVQQAVAPTNISVVVPPVTISSPHRSRHTPSSRGSSLCMIFVFDLLANSVNRNCNVRMSFRKYLQCLISLFIILNSNKTFNIFHTFSASLDTLYGPSILHMLPNFLHRADGITNVKPVRPVQ
jgi:hypothetical protein